MISSDNPFLEEFTDADKRYLLDAACQLSLDEKRKIDSMHERNYAYGVAQGATQNKPPYSESSTKKRLESDVKRYEDIQQLLRQRAVPMPQSWRK